MPVKNKIEGPTEQRKIRGRMQKEEIQIEGKKVQVYRMMDLLSLLFSRGQINEKQHKAGLIFYRDWYYSGLSGAVAIDYSKIKVDVSSMNNTSFRSLSAVTRWQAAVKEIGRVHCHPLTNMILLEQSPEEYGLLRGHKNPKLARLVAITLLQNSLDALADHYF